MANNQDIGTPDETLAFIPSATGSLFAILTSPRDLESNGRTVILLQGSGNTSTHRNRLWVRLARRLASEGFHAIRFDYHGIGESEGSVDGYALNRPFSADLEAVISWAERLGNDRYVLVGSCFGARTALAAAQGVEQLEGLVLINNQVWDLKRSEEEASRAARDWSLSDYLRRALRPKVIKGLLKRDRRKAYLSFLRMRLRRSIGGVGNSAAELGAGKHFLDSLSPVLSRRIPMNLIYGVSDGCYKDFCSARTGRLGAMIEDAPRVEVTVLDHKIAGFQEVEGQIAVIDTVTKWLNRLTTSQAV